MGLKVWVVEEGYYSDRGIVAIFSTEEKAIDFIRKQKEVGRGHDIHDEPWDVELDPEVADPLDYFPFKYFYWIEIEKDGTITYKSQGGMDLLDPKRTQEEFYFKKKDEYDYERGDILQRPLKSSTVVLHGFINAYSMEHAMALMGEKRKKFLDKWPNPEEFNVWGQPIYVY